MQAFYLGIIIIMGREIKEDLLLIVTINHPDGSKGMLS